MSAEDDCETFEGARCVGETPKAIKVRLDNGDEHWIPKSVIDDDSEVYQSDTDGKLIIKSWFCEQEGIE